MGFWSFPNLLLPNLLFLVALITLFKQCTKKQKKHCSIAYFWWVFGGPFGLYHIYLNRDYNWFVWFSSFGGFLIGWILDLLFIPQYVRRFNAANDMKPQEFITFICWENNTLEFKPTTITNHIPIFFQIFGILFITTWYEAILSSALDGHGGSPIAMVLQWLVRAIGVHFSSSMGRRRSSFINTFLTAGLTDVLLRLVWCWAPDLATVKWSLFCQPPPGILNSTSIIISTMVAIYSQQVKGAMFDTLEAPAAKSPNCFTRSTIITGGAILWIFVSFHAWSNSSNDDSLKGLILKPKKLV